MLLSAYEIQREERIRANKAMLASLGLSAPSTAAVADVGEAGRERGKEDEGLWQPATQRKAALKHSRKSGRDTPIAVPPGRRSRRLQSCGPEFGGAMVTPAAAAKQRQVALAVISEEDRQRKYGRLLERHARDGVDLPPRATYEHTLRRVLSMSEKAL